MFFTATQSLRCLVLTLALALLYAHAVNAQSDMLTIESSRDIPLSGGGQFVVFNPASTEIAVGTSQGLEVYELSGGKLVLNAGCTKGKASAAAASPDGSLLALGCEDGSILLSNWSGSRPPEALGRHSKRVASLAFAPNNATLVSAGDDKSIVLWDVNSRHEVQRFPSGSKKNPVFVGFGAQGLSIVAVTQDGAITEWDAKSGRLLRNMNLDENTVFGAALGSDGKLLAIGGEFATLNKGSWGNTPGQAPSSNGPPSANTPASSPMGGPGRFGSGPGINPADFYRDDRILVFDLHEGKVVKQIEGLKGQLRGLSISRDNRFLAAALQKTKETHLSVYDLERGIEILSQPSKDRAPLVGFSPNGKYLADVAPTGALALMTVAGVRESDHVNLPGARIRAMGPTSPLITATPNLSLAIMDLECSKDPDMGRNVAEMLRTAIVGAHVQVVAYDRMQEIIKQQNWEQSARTDAHTAVALGKILNANKTLFGTVGLSGSTYIVTIHLVDVETAQDTGVREVRCDRCTAEDLPDIAEELRAITVSSQ